VPNVKGNVSGRNELASFLQEQADLLAPPGIRAASAGSFQASESAVSAVHDSVTAAQGRLAERMASTSERVSAAARGYADAEDSSAAGLRAVSEAPGD
jgi:hypothetical protein